MTGSPIVPPLYFACATAYLILDAVAAGRYCPWSTELSLSRHVAFHRFMVVLTAVVFLAVVVTGAALRSDGSRWGFWRFIRPFGSSGERSGYLIAPLKLALPSVRMRSTRS